MIDGRAALSGNREGSGWSSGGGAGILNASSAPGTLDTLTTSNNNAANTSNTATSSSNGASQHAHQLLQIACASACRSTGFDAATPAAVALFAEVAAARLAGLARAAAAASVFTGVASMKPESAPSTSTSYFQSSSSQAQSESHSTTSNPHSLSHSNHLDCSNSVSSHASSLLLLLSCTRTSGSSTLLGADADLLDTDSLLALRRLVLAGALTASISSGAEKEKDKEKDLDREKAATLPLPSIPLVSLDIFPRVKPVSFPVPTPVAPPSISLHSTVPANQSHLPSPTLSSSLDTATSIEQKSSDSHLQPPKNAHLPVNTSATAVAGVHGDSLNEVQTGDDNLNDSDSESDLASEDEDDDNSNPSGAAANAAARKQSRQESSSSRRKNRRGRSSRSSRVHHPYLLPVDLNEGIQTIDGTLRQAHFKGNPSLPSFLTATSSGSQSSDSVHRKMFTAIPIPFKNNPNDASSSSSSSKPVSVPPTKPPATSRDLHQHALRTMLHPAAAPTATFLSSNANMQHSLGASLSERQMLLRGTAVTLGAGVGASGGGGEGSGGVESLWGYAGVGGGGGGGGLLEGLMNSKGLSVKTNQSVFAVPAAMAPSMVGGPSDGKSGGLASNSTSGGGGSAGGSGMMMGGVSILGGIGTDLMRNNSMLGNSSGGSPNILPGVKGGLGSGMQRPPALPLGYQMSGSSGSGIGRMGGGVGPSANGASLASGVTSFGGGSGGAESGGSSSGNTGGTKIKFKLSVNK
ncbi:hypothetical protein HDU81_004520 [Chytriomyces hyalinus]|nr:hypothetical protein HDU81_004520 [Chytriomyces hyalinus]